MIVFINAYRSYTQVTHVRCDQTILLDILPLDMVNQLKYYFGLSSRTNYSCGPGEICRFEARILIFGTLRHGLLFGRSDSWTW